MKIGAREANIYNKDDYRQGVIDAIQNMYDNIETDNRKLVLNNVTIGEPNMDSQTWRSFKDAKLHKKTIGNPIIGDFHIFDKDRGRIIDRAKIKLGDLPDMTHVDNFIVNGAPYNIQNQRRLRPGAYSRIADTGDTEIYTNVEGGRTLRTSINPENGKINTRIGTTTIPHVPLLLGLGVKEEDIKDQIGEELFNKNNGSGVGVLSKYHKTLYPYKYTDGKKEFDRDEMIADIKTYNDKTKLNPDITEKILGKKFDHVSPDYLLNIMSELVQVTRGDKEPTNREDIYFEDILSVTDLVPDSINRKSKYDQKYRWKIKSKLNAKDKVSDVVDRSEVKKRIESYFNSSKISMVTPQVNPYAILSMPYQTTLMGEGAISNIEAVPSSAKDVHDSHFGFFDILHTPESQKGGVTLHMTMDTRKNGKTIETRVIDVNTGREAWLDKEAAHEEAIAFPGEFIKSDKPGEVYRPKNREVACVYGGKMMAKHYKNVHYMLYSIKGMHDIASNSLPFINSTQGNRLSVGAKQVSQAVALENPELPLVDVAVDGVKLSKQLGEKFSIVAAEAGTVVAVNNDEIVVKTKDGQKKIYDMPDNVPLSDHAYVTGRPKVKAGDAYKKGDILADTNFTENGEVALGKNLNVAYSPWYGKNYEDAVVFTESGAKKMRSTHMYEEEFQKNETTDLSLDKFMAYNPKAIKKQEMSKYDEDGVIMPGMTVKKDDILVAGLKKVMAFGTDRFVDLLRKSKVQPYQENTIKWTHDKEGIVTDVVKDNKGVSVFVKVNEDLKVGDKIVGRYGNKGIVSEVIPDAIAPKLETGETIDILIDPNSVVPRINPGQWIETAASRIAEKKGKQMVIENYSQDYRKKVLGELSQLGLKEKRSLYDPQAKKTIPNIFAGKQYFYKLNHLGDLKLSARGVDAPYTQDMQPARGGQTSGQSIDRLTSHVLLAHNARNFLRDTYSIDSGRNDDYWDAIQDNRIPPTPKTPYVWNKFVDLLRTMGVNTVKNEDSIGLVPFMDKDVMALSAGEIRNPYKMFKGKGIGMEPEKNGLFGEDVKGIRGDVFNHITLSEAVPSPAYKKAIMSLLKLKGDEYEQLVSEDN